MDAAPLEAAAAEIPPVPLRRARHIVTVNLLRLEAAAEFERRVREAYRARFGLAPEVYRCRPAAGAGELL